MWLHSMVSILKSTKFEIEIKLIWLPINMISKTKFGGIKMVFIPTNLTKG